MTDIVLTSKDFKTGLANQQRSDPDRDDFQISKAKIYMANSIIFHADNGRKKVLKSRELPNGWIDYAIHIEWEVRDDEQFPYHEARRMGGEAYMMCNECGGRLWSFDGNEDRDIRCPYRGTDKAEAYGCEL